MKRFLLSVSTLGLLLVGVGSAISSCSREERASRQSAANDEVVVSNFDVEAVTKSATTYYTMKLAGDTSYLTLNASIQWPTKVGEYNIKVLQDSILSLAFPADDKGDVDESIRSFVTDVSVLGDSTMFDRLSKLPDDATESTAAYEMAVSGKVLEINESFVTYVLTSYSYTGGAHPNSASYPFTYSLDGKTVLTIGNMFKPGSEEVLTRVVQESLARQFNVPASHLTAAGLFSDSVPLTDKVYVLNGELMFHYNTYDIAPHSMGAIDVEVYPYEVEHYLTDLGASVLIGK